MHTNKHKISFELTDEQIATVDQAFETIFNVINPIAKNLSPEERQRYGRVKEENKLFMNKVNEMFEQRPDFIPPVLDFEGHKQKAFLYEVFERWSLRLTNIGEKCRDTRILVGNDWYAGSRNGYAYVSYLNQMHVPGSETWYRELRQFFKGGRRSENRNEEQPPTDMAMPPGDA